MTRWRKCVVCFEMFPTREEIEKNKPIKIRGVCSECARTITQWFGRERSL